MLSKRSYLPQSWLRDRKRKLIDLSDPRNLLLWDLDGTIIDSSRDLARAINSLLQDYELPTLPTDIVVSHIGRGARNLVARCLEERDHILSTESDHDEALERFETHYRGALIVDTTIYPTLFETLHELSRRGRKMALVTNKPERPSREILVQLGLDACFPVVVGGDSLATRKPDPAPVLNAVSQLSAGPLDPVVMIGDTSIDTEAARSAGVFACGVGWGLGDRGAARNAAPDWWFDSPEEFSRTLLGS